MDTTKEQIEDAVEWMLNIAPSKELLNLLIQLSKQSGDSGMHSRILTEIALRNVKVEVDWS